MRKMENVNKEEGTNKERSLKNELEKARDKAKRNILRAYVTILWNFTEEDVMS
jgi:hypothetical protein